ncbi:MAG: hypothetical protein KatS3mg113_0182 [Planctomycetaceae bacterium]|nr:MAG: hypothetical protein KatS3mg113_0182 [Planctomycetaceae bacterium]
MAGTDARGIYQIWVDRESGELTGEWSLQGEMLGEVVEYRLQLPRAPSLHLYLRLPDQHIPHAVSPNVLIERDSSEDQTHTGWWLRFLPGEEHRWQIHLPRDSSSSPGRLAYRQTMGVEVREDHVRFQAKFIPEVWQGTVHQLTFSLPAEVELYAVQLEPDEDMEWQRQGVQGTRQHVVLTLPHPWEPGVNPPRPVRLEGIISSPSSVNNFLPQVSLMGGIFLGGRQIISVLRPLQITGYRWTGCRQSAPLVPAADRETLELEQLVPHPRITLDLRRPTSHVSAQMLSVLTHQHEQWVQSVWLKLTAGDTAPPQFTCLLPSGWRMLTLEAFRPGGTPERVVWETIPTTQGETLLRLELAQGLSNQQPRMIRWKMRLTAETPADLLHPLPRLQEGVVQESWLAVSLPRHLVRCQTTREEQLPSSPPEHPWWQEPDWIQTTESLSEALWFPLANPADMERLLVEPPLTPVAAHVEIHFSIQAQRVHESYRVSLIPQAKCDRVWGWLSEEAEAISWQLETPADWSLITRPIPRHRAAEAHVPSQGGLWEWVLPVATSEPVVIVGQRERPLQTPGRAGLLWIPQASSFQGTIALADPPDESLEFLSRGLQPQMPGTARHVASLRPLAADASRAQTPIWKSWHYASPRDELRWISSAEGQVHTSRLARMELTSLLASPGEAYDLHRVDCWIHPSEGSWELELPAPAQPISTLVNGQEHHWTERRLLLTSQGESPQHIEILYRTPAASGFWQTCHQFPVPHAKGVCWTDFRWRVSQPPTMRSFETPAGIHWVTPLPTISWMRRLFGPLGREAHDRIFLPWQATAWSQLWKGTTAGDEPREQAFERWQTQTDELLPGRTLEGWGPVPPSQLSLYLWRLERLELAEWLGLLCCFTLGVVLRRCGLRLKEPLLIVLLAVLFTSACFSAVPWAEVAGSCWTGILLALLVPRPWLRHVPWQAMNADSRQGTPVATILKPTLTSFLLLGTCMLLLPHLEAQVSPPTNAPSAPDRTSQSVPGKAAPNDDWVFWVPVDEHGQPSSRLPLIYTTETVMQALEAQSQNKSWQPDWLLARAVYRVRGPSDSVLNLTAIYEVWLWDQATNFALQLPFSPPSPANLVSCRVDDQPAGVVVLPDGRGVNLTLRPPEKPVSAVGEPQFSRHIVVMEWSRPVRSDPSDTNHEWSVPAVHDSLLLLPEQASTLDTAWARGGWRPAFGTDLGFILGPISRLKLARLPLNSPNARPAEIAVPVEHFELWQVGANASWAHGLMQFTPPSGLLKRVTLRLPPGVDLRSARSNPPARLQRERIGDSVHVHCTWSADVKQPVTLEYQTVQEHVGNPTEFIWEGCTLVNSERITFNIRQTVLGIVVMGEATIRPESIEAAGVVPLAWESVKKQFEPLNPEQPPRAVYQAPAGRRILFRVHPAAGRLITSQLIRGHLGPERLNLTWQVTIDPPALPVYAHQFVLDRRLQVEQLSIQERGAERVMRWSDVRTLENKLLTVFLSDPMLETQQVTLTASLPVNPESSELALPHVWLDQATWQAQGKARWELIINPRWQADWLNTTDFRPLTTAAAPTTQSPRRWEFDILRPEARGRIMLRPHDEQTLRRGIGLLLHDGPYEVIWQGMLLPATLPAAKTLQLDLPSPWQLEPSSLAQVHTATHLTTSGRRGVRYEFLTDSTQLMTLQARLAWSHIDQQLPLPQLSFTDGTTVGGYLLEAAPAVIPSRLASRSPEVPPWAEAFVREHLPSHLSVRWLGPIEAETTSWPVLPQDQRLQSVSTLWLEHRCSPTSTGELVGSTVCWLAEPSLRMAWALPPGVSLMGAEVDGVPADWLFWYDRTCLLAANDGRRFQEVRLFWKAERLSRSGLLLWNESLVWPQPASAQSGQTLLMHTRSANFPAYMIRGWPRTDHLDRALHRLEVLQSLQHSDTPVTPWMQQRADISWQTLTSQLQQEYRQSISSDALRLTRWEGLLQRHVSRANDEKLSESHVPRPLAEEWLSLSQQWDYAVVPADRTSLRLWGPSPLLIRQLLASAVFILAMLSIRLLRTPRWREKLYAHPQRALAILGGIWWLAFTPSIFGFSLLLWVVYRSLWARWQRRRHLQVEPS